VLVEDEELVRTLAELTLVKQGYRVFSFGSGEEALDRVRAMHEPLHLLLTDVVLPGLNGKEVAEQMVLLRPGIRVIYVSGYPDDVISHHGVLDPGIDFIPKPYSLETLARRVRASLDGAEPDTGSSTA
jgi:DNA-binding response OmpR family regulator